MVRLKDTDTRHTQTLPARFHSKMVRLKAGYKIIRQTERLRFHSKMVRLKGFVKSVLLSYLTLVGCVNWNVCVPVFRAVLLSIVGRANSIGVDGSRQNVGGSPFLSKDGRDHAV